MSPKKFDLSEHKYRLIYENTDQGIDDAKMKKILILVVPLLAGCTTEDTPALAEITVQLKWLHQAQFAGMYVAEHEGIYKRHGLRIESFIPFNFTNWPIIEVEQKKVPFAVTGGEELIQAKAEGRADHVKAIAVIYKLNPVCLYSLKSSGITKPTDLIGKTVGIERAADGKELNIGILYYAMLNKLEINKSAINEITIGYDATELLEGVSDVSSGYVINEPHQAIEEGYDVNIILPAEYGVNMYADVLIAHEDMIQSEPDLVRDFVMATLEGWQMTIENQDLGVGVTMNYTNSSRSHQHYMLEKSIPLINTGNSKLGYMDEGVWESMVEILQDNEIIPHPIEVEELYTNDFLS